MSLTSFLDEWSYPGPLRSVGTPDQYLETNPVEVIQKLIETGKNNVYMSVNPYDKDGGISCIDRVFFDFDNKIKVRYAWDDALRLNESLAKHYGIGALTVFSGKKGYHVHVFLKEPVIGPPEYLARLYKELSKLLLKGEKYDNIDKSPSSVKNLARVPYSTHQDTGELVVPVTPELEPFKLEQGFTKALRDNGVGPELVNLAERNLYKVKPKSKTKIHKNGGLRPCIEAALNLPSVHDGLHIMKVAAIAEMNAENFTFDQMDAYFCKMDGYNPEKTRYFIEHSLNRGYKPFKCETIKNNGGCLGENCGRAS